MRLRASPRIIPTTGRYFRVDLAEVLERAAAERVEKRKAEADAIEARARKRDTFTSRPLPSCDHEERGHAPACFACTSAARAAEEPTFHEHGRSDVLALVARVRELEEEI